MKWNLAFFHEITKIAPVELWKPCQSPLLAAGDLLRSLLRRLDAHGFAEWAGICLMKRASSIRERPLLLFRTGMAAVGHVAAASRQSSKCWSGCQWSLPGMFERSSIKKSLLHSVENEEFFDHLDFTWNQFWMTKILTKQIPEPLKLSAQIE